MTTLHGLGLIGFGLGLARLGWSLGLTLPSLSFRVTKYTR